MPARRIVLIAAGATVVIVAGIATAFGAWISRPAPKVALHSSATASNLGSPSAIPTTPSATPTSPEATASPTQTAAGSGPSLPVPLTPRAHQAMLGSDADGRPILATVENNPNAQPTTPEDVMTTTWKWDGTRWNALRSDRQIGTPGTLIYDPYLKKTVVLVGGVTMIPYTMWGFDSNGWTNLQPATVPATGMDSATVALDAAHKQLIALDPESDQKLSMWVFDGVTWKSVTPANLPPARSRAAFAYDPVSSTLLLYGGGRVVGGLPMDDTWTWDGTTWTERHPATTPGGCLGQITYDPVTNTMILLCPLAQASASEPGFTMWAWNETTWTPVHPATMPPAAWEWATTYDAPSRELLLFLDAKGPNPVQTWTYANGNWKQKA